MIDIERIMEIEEVKKDSRENKREGHLELHHQTVDTNVLSYK